MRFSDAGLRCFGPSRLAARLEGSKAFAKEFLQRHAHPDRRLSRTFTRRRLRQRLAARATRTPIVVKASGLAAGKGVVIAETPGAGRSRRRARCSAAASALPAPRS